MPVELDSSATLLDVVHLVRYAVIEIAAAIVPSSRAADEVLIKLANRLHEQGQDQRLNERDRLLVSALATQLIGTEPGA
jgi:hypothetical protein